MLQHQSFVNFKACMGVEATRSPICRTNRSNPGLDPNKLNIVNLNKNMIHQAEIKIQIKTHACIHIMIWSQRL